MEKPLIVHTYDNLATATHRYSIATQGRDYYTRREVLVVGPGDVITGTLSPKDMLKALIGDMPGTTRITELEKYMRRPVVAKRTEWDKIVDAALKGRNTFILNPRYENRHDGRKHVTVPMIEGEVTDVNALKMMNELISK